MSAPKTCVPAAAISRGEVALIEPLGVETILHIKTGDATLLCVVSGLSAYKLGETLSFDFAADRLHYFDMDGRRI
ncbi:MAG: TOBE domain-containing protein [Chloroflexi bacterium]|nr:TOBE domain-containing protein [Chloroflexota bacterium]